MPELETIDDLKRRIDEAAKFVPLDQLAISPQCGFASDVVGNLISADDQKRKLELIVETARQVWGLKPRRPARIFHNSHDRSITAALQAAAA